MDITHSNVKKDGTHLVNIGMQVEVGGLVYGLYQKTSDKHRGSGDR
ncbi:MAG: hypothetical protein IME94_09770 [Proteobacteria bacterium]|nr:hypothetical protein [Pseudomonadota bacterium]